MSELIISPPAAVEGEYTPPGDKSISHRLAMLGALGEGTSEYIHFSEAEDCQKTIEAFSKLGVQYDLQKAVGAGPQLKVKGVGLRGLAKPSGELDLGNSGTTMRLILGILAGQPFEARPVGDASLSQRPMRRVTVPLRQMGAAISGRDDANFAPLEIRGGKLSAIEWENKAASAQVKSAILLAGLYADGVTSVCEPLVTRDHTERLLRLFGASIECSEHKVAVQKPECLRAICFDVPGDFSSAAFLIAAALLVKGSNLLVSNVGLNPTRLGFYNVLKSMGAAIEIDRVKDQAEPVGDLRVRGSRLKGITIDRKMTPFLIDELPVLMVLCALAEGISTIFGAQELRIKETDRIRSMASGLRAVGARILEREDGCVIEGVPELLGGRVSSFGDHRTAMSFAVAGLRSRKGVTILDSECIGISYPGFEKDLRSVCRM